MNMPVMLIGLILLIGGVGAVVIDQGIIDIPGVSATPATDKTEAVPGLLPTDIAGIPIVGIGAGLALIGLLATYKGFTMF